IESALEIAEGDVGVDAEAFNLMKDRRVCGVLCVIPMYLAGNDDADRRRLGLHGAHLDRRGVRAQKKAVAKGASLLIGDDEGVLRVARGMTRRKVHALEVVEIGFDFRSNANG